MSRAWIISCHRLTRTSESAVVLNCVSFGPLHYYLVAGCTTSLKVHVNTKQCSGKKDRIEKKCWLATLSLKEKAQVTGIPVACRARNCELRGSLSFPVLSWPNHAFAVCLLSPQFVFVWTCLAFNFQVIYSEPCTLLQSGIVPTLQNPTGIGLVGFTEYLTVLLSLWCDNQSC